jgi:hypothetical protein
MKHSAVSRVVLTLSILAVILISAFIFVTPPAAYADGATLQGTWSSQVQYTCGLRNGQTDQATVVYNGDGTMTSITAEGLQGSGFWSMVNQDEFQYQFIEQIYQGGQNIGYVVVSEEGVLTNDGNGNYSYGIGTFYAYDSSGGIVIAAQNCTSVVQSKNWQNL